MNKRTVRIIPMSVLGAVSIAGIGVMIARRIRSRKTPAGAGKAERPEDPETESQSRRESVMNKRTVRVILTSVLAAVFVVSAGMTAVQQMRSRKTLADTEEAARLAGLRAEPRHTETASPAEEPPKEPPEDPEEEPLPEEARELAGLDLEALRAVNEDVVGWIAIPGTVVSYPLVQGADNQYYLSRNWKKEPIASGSVFLSSDAARDLTDFHTIVYGHYMRDETMFGTIKYYLGGADYWREHPSIYIVLDDVIYRYDIFSAQEASVAGPVFQFGVIQEESLKERFLQYCKDHSVLDTGLSPGTDDRILTLSTCTSVFKRSYRNVVHGVLVREYRRTNM